MSILSVVIPSYNEEKMISKTAKVVAKILEDAGIDYELIFVNDGSKDNTWAEIEAANASNKKVRGVCFSRNFGKEGAILAGMSLAKGDCAAVMDCDLQHPPEILVTMYELWTQGYQVVEGVKASRGKESGLHKLAANTFYKIISDATNIDMSNASDFKLLDRKAVDAFLSLPERHIFFRALSSWIGFKTAYVEFHVADRTEGVSKWSIKSLTRYAVSNITSFSTFPMQLVTGCGLLFFLFSIFFGIYSLVKYFMGESLEGFTTVILLILITGSILMLGIGVIGYYIARIYDEVRIRPRYIIASTTDQPSITKVDTIS